MWALVAEMLMLALAIEILIPVLVAEIPMLALVAEILMRALVAEALMWVLVAKMPILSLVAEIPMLTLEADIPMLALVIDIPMPALVAENLWLEPLAVEVLESGIVAAVEARELETFEVDLLEPKVLAVEKTVQRKDLTLEKVAWAAIPLRREPMSIASGRQSGVKLATAHACCVLNDLKSLDTRKEPGNGATGSVATMPGSMIVQDEVQTGPHQLFDPCFVSRSTLA